MHYFGASKVIIVNKTGMAPGSVHPLLLWLRQVGNALELSGIFIYSRYETTGPVYCYEYAIISLFTGPS